MYAIVAGGGKVGYYLGRELIDQGHEVLIIEQLADRAAFIANELGNVVLRGNADEASTLAEAGARRADVVIAVTGDDEDNLVICQVAKKRFGAQRTIARINDPRNEGIFRKLGIDSTVNATEATLVVLEQEIPNTSRVSLSRLKNSDVVVVEATIAPRSPAAGRSIRELGMPEDCFLPLLIRDGVYVSATPDTALQVDDLVIVLMRSVNEARLRSLLLPP